MLSDRLLLPRQHPAAAGEGEMVLSGPKPLLTYVSSELFAVLVFLLERA